MMYTIGEVEKITGISKDRLRNYEKNKILNPDKEANNQYRMYNEKDIIQVLSMEHFRMMDLSIKDIRVINEHGSVQDILNKVIEKKEKVEAEIVHLQKQLEMLSQTETSCFHIVNKSDDFTIKSMPQHTILGTISDTCAFDEYVHFREQKKKDIPMIKSMLRKISFNDSEITGNEVFIVEEKQSQNVQSCTYDKCLYKIMKESVDGTDLLEELFMKSLQYMKNNHYEPLNVAFIKPMLINFTTDEAYTFLEIYIPIK